MDPNKQSFFLECCPGRKPKEERRPGECDGGNDCCQYSCQCPKGGGDCDTGADCQKYLDCGDNNCSGPNFGSDDDCCEIRRYVG